MSIQDFINQFKSEPYTKLARRNIDYFLANLTEKQKLEKVIKTGEFWAKVTLGYQSISIADAVAEKVGRQLQELEKKGEIYEVSDDNDNFLGLQVTKNYLDDK